MRMQRGEQPRAAGAENENVGFNGFHEGLLTTDIHRRTLYSSVAQMIFCTRNSAMRSADKPNSSPSTCSVC